MKVAITGHTSGIGKELFDLFPNAMGFSRSNGYDITEKESRLNIIKEITECDIFVNNAHSGFSQTDLLFDIWDLWKYRDKKIICIGSRVSNLIYTNYPYSEYAVNKSALESAASYMSHQELPCKVTLIKPGYIDTPAVKNKNVRKMDPKELALFIKNIMEIPQSFWIPEITIYPK